MYFDFFVSIFKEIFSNYPQVFDCLSIDISVIQC